MSVWMVHVTGSTEKVQSHSFYSANTCPKWVEFDEVLELPSNRCWCDSQRNASFLVQL
jgi:hypothetical protein